MDAVRAPDLRRVLELVRAAPQNFEQRVKALNAFLDATEEVDEARRGL